MECKFKAGDLVRCINNDDIIELTLGKIYTVLSVYQSFNRWHVFIKEISQNVIPFTYRFEPVNNIESQCTEVME